MNKKNLFGLCFVYIAIFILPLNFSFARVNDNSGFVSDRVWYSKEPLVDGETVNIHTAIWNGEESRISLTVLFYDKKTILGKRDMVLEARELKNVFIPWKVTKGDHLISAKIVDSFSLSSNEKTKILLKENSTTPDKKFVSVKILNRLGASAMDSSPDSEKNETEKTNLNLNNILPDNIKKPIIDIFYKIDNFRLEKYETINNLKNEIKQEIDKKDTLSDDKNKEDQSNLIILYIKFYLLLILAFVLASQLLFYGLIVAIIFYILKLIFSRR